jgi:hypothetical protein
VHGVNVLCAVNPDNTRRSDSERLLPDRFYALQVAFLLETLYRETSSLNSLPTNRRRYVHKNGDVGEARASVDAIDPVQTALNGLIGQL